jgi:hypothetical protein
MTRKEHIMAMKHYKAQLDDAFKMLRKSKSDDDKWFYISAIESIADNIRSEARSAKSAEE